MDWRKIRRDLAWATGHQFTTKLVGYLVLVVLIRHLDKARMGEFLFAATLATFVAVLTELGTHTHLNRSVASDPENALLHLSKVLSLQLPLIGVSFLMISAFGIAFKRDILTTILLTSVYTLLQQIYWSFGAFLLGLRRVAYRVATQLTAQVILAASIILVVVHEGGLEAVLACYIFANAIAVSVTVLLVRSKFGRLSLAWDSVSARAILRTSLPLFAVTILGVMHYKVDTLMLGFMQSYSTVATYEAAYKLLEASRSLLRPGVMIFFPICAALAANQEWATLSGLTRRMLVAATGAAVMVAMLVVVTAGAIVSGLFGARYEDSVPVLRILFLTAPSLFVVMVGTFLCSALHLEKSAVKIMAVSLALNIGLNSVLIPLWGATGAAWTTLASQTILAACLVPLVTSSLAERRAVAESVTPSPRWSPVTEFTTRTMPDDEAS